MRPIPSRIVFSVVAGTALVLWDLASQPMILVVAAAALGLLLSSLAASRVPLTRALDEFRGRTVDIRLWGDPPPDGTGVDFVVTAVNLLGAGVHVYFDQPNGRSAHLKIAQPKNADLASGSVVVGTAKYVQWNRTKLSPRREAAAVSIVLRDS